MAFQIIRNDITKVAADAIVNTANPEPVFGSGTDSAIYHAAGEDALLAERGRIGEMQPGEVNVTDAYGLQARYIIHTVGPSWIDGHHGEYEMLASCYRKSLHLAYKLGCASIAFPLIATGVYGFPKDEALQIALREIRTFLETAEMDVTLVVFSRRSYELSRTLTQSVRQFIDDNYCMTASEAEYGSWNSYPDEDALIPKAAESRSVMSEDMMPAEAEEDEEPLSDRSVALPDQSRRRRLFDFSLRSRRAQERRQREEKRADADEKDGKVSEQDAGTPSPSMSSVPFKPMPTSSGAAGAAGAMERREAEKSAGIPGGHAAEKAERVTGPQVPVSDRSMRGAPAPAPGGYKKVTWDSVFTSPQKPVKEKSLKDLIDQAGETFQEMLLRKIDEKGMSAPEVYKRANIDKKLFSKIRNNPDYVPKKQTAVALAIALKLNLDETADLIGRAGLALSPSSKFDLIITYCIEHHNYDMFEINALLFDYEQPLLGV